MKLRIIIASAVVITSAALFTACSNQSSTPNTTSTPIANREQHTRYEEYAMRAEEILTQKVPAQERIKALREFCREVTQDFIMVKMTAEGAERCRQEALHEINIQLSKNNNDPIKTFQALIRLLESYKGTQKERLARFIMNGYCEQLTGAKYFC